MRRCAHRADRRSGTPPGHRQREKKEPAVPSDSLSVVHAFIHAINTHEPTRLFHLMTEDHLFVDSGGDSIRGREEMRKAWVAYFYLVPDYLIDASEMLEKDATVAVFGIARGTAGKQREAWQMPAAWKAVVRGGRIAEWHVYADNEPVRRILAAQGVNI